MKTDGSAQPDDIVRFEVPLTDTIDVATVVEAFRRVGDDLIDRFDGSRLIRAIPKASGFAPYVAEIQPGPVSSLVVQSTASERDIVEVGVPGSFAAAPDDWSRLLTADDRLPELNLRFPGIRPVLQLDLFTALVRSVSAQQINLRWAATIRARLAKRYGVRREIAGLFVYVLEPERLANSDPRDIRALQFTTRKAESIVEIARECANGLSLETLRPLSDDDVIARLVRIKGIGLWSAEWILCRSLGRPRVVAGDLGVRKAVGRTYLDGRMPSEAEVREITAHWGESAAVAQVLILHALALNA